MNPRIIFSCLFGICMIWNSQAQNIDELKSRKATKQEAYAKEKAEADALKSEIDQLTNQILKLSGWKTGFSGMMGFDFNKSNGWANNPNPDARSTALNLGLTVFANQVGPNHFWKNKLIFRKSWLDVDLTEEDQNENEDGLFDNGTVDIFNISSLYGRTLSDNFSLSALGELSSSLGSFLDPGTFDIGIGTTWTPVDDLVVIVHPLNYHLAFSGFENVDTEGLLGCKLRADYTRKFPSNITWSSTFTSFIPYQSKEPSLFEYTWLNTVSVNIWKGVGLGFSLGIRKAEFELEDTQSFYAFGVTYAL